MSITKEQSDQLKDYFSVNAHEFLQGATYLSEEAITNRLDDVDPSWEFHRLGEFSYRDNFVIATFRMTVCGVSRDGVGMWDLKMKKKDGNVIDATDPEKSVSTDALKRCARLFGIGRYILEMGKAVNDYGSLERWLLQRRGVDRTTGEIEIAKRTPQQALHGNGSSERTIAPQTAQNGVKTTPPATPVAQSEGQNAPSPAVGANSGNWEYDLPALMAHPDLLKMYPRFEHRSNAIKKVYDGGYFANVANLSEAVKVMLARPDKVSA